MSNWLWTWEHAASSANAIDLEHQGIRGCHTLVKSRVAQESRHAWLCRRRVWPPFPRSSRALQLGPWHGHSGTRRVCCAPRPWRHSVVRAAEAARGGDHLQLGDRLGGMVKVMWSDPDHVAVDSPRAKLGEFRRNVRGR